MVTCLVYKRYRKPILNFQGHEGPLPRQEGSHYQLLHFVFSEELGTWEVTFTKHSHSLITPIYFAVSAVTSLGFISQIPHFWQASGLLL